MPLYDFSCWIFCALYYELQLLCQRVMIFHMLDICVPYSLKSSCQQLHCMIFLYDENNTMIVVWYLVFATSDFS